jgi:glucose-6-phosphate 1-dehydrogenase
MPSLHCATPTILVIFGATGDLSQRKLIPALFDLHLKGALPECLKIVGFSRREWSDAEFRSFAHEILEQRRDYPIDALESFVQRLSYQSGEFENEAQYAALGERLHAIDAEWGVCSSKLFYLAVPPIAYETILTRLAQSGLTRSCSDGEGWTRVLIEKPFGRDIATAQHLDTLLGQLFQEEQIFRIDHYLAKETLQNILAFRFGNRLFEPAWNHREIDRVELRVFETVDVSERGSFYDDIGALRDVGQNHLLQMLALVAMEQPETLSDADIRTKRAEVLRSVRLLGDLETSVWRGQYEGYRQEKGVASESTTETAFRVRAMVDTERWRGVPFILESGKAMKERRAEIIVVFKSPERCWSELHCALDQSNRITFEIQPQERASLRVWVKQPGIASELIAKDWHFDAIPKETNQSVIADLSAGVVTQGKADLSAVAEAKADAYEKILFDAITGDQTLFASTNEVRAAWHFITPILEQWHNLPLHRYVKGIVSL